MKKMIITAAALFFIVLIPVVMAGDSAKGRIMAESYVKEHGGRTIRFNDITMDMLSPTKHETPKRR